jgi:hypothetical protein
MRIEVEAPEYLFKNLRTAFAGGDLIQKIAEALAQRRRDNIDKQIDYRGDPLPPLSRLTIKLKGHSTILIDTGQMRDDIVATKKRANVSEVGFRTPDSEEKMELSIEGSQGEENDYYSAGERPPRNPWGNPDTEYIDPEDISIIENVVNDYMESVLSDN